ELDEAVPVILARNLAEVGAGHRLVANVPRGVVEEVGAVHTEFDALALRDPYDLGCLEVEVPNRGSIQDRATEGTESPRTGFIEDLAGEGRRAIVGDSLSVRTDGRSGHVVRSGRSHADLEEVTQLRQGQVGIDRIPGGAAATIEGAAAAIQDGDRRSS